MNSLAVAIFVVFVAATLAITYWSSRRATSMTDFYAAGGCIKPWQNGLAIAGDYLSAASFLGTVSVFFSFGLDGLLYAVGAAAGWPVVTCLVAERLRRLGHHTFSDVLCHRLGGKPLRAMTAVTTLCICGMYLVSQMVGAGTLVQVLFHVPYAYAVTMVGVLMTVYVMFGGMVATTWIQIVKATILIAGGAFMGFLVLRHYAFDSSALLAAAASTRSDPSSLLLPSGLMKDPMSAISLALAFSLGPGGMPHVLMRFFTVKDGAAARRSLIYGSSVIAGFQAIVVLLGFGAIALVTNDPQFRDANGALIGGANVAAVYLSYELGGSILFGVVAAVTFATILAVVSGVTLAAAQAISHDLFKEVFTSGSADQASEVRVSKAATGVIGAASIGLGLLFQHQNIGFLATLPLVIAASANFPILLLAMYWPGLTRRGATAGGITGLTLSVGLMIASPKVWSGALGLSNPPFPYEYPTLISTGAAFIVAWLISVADAGATRS